MLLGERLGRGVDRETFVCAYEPTRVVKVCIGEFDFQNIAEWVLWNSAKPNLAKWLAPCRRISPDGKVLIMERCEPIPSSLMPDRVPEILADDLHRNNVGLYEGHPVCLDYGRHTATLMAANAKRLVTPVNLETLSDKRGW